MSPNLNTNRKKTQKMSMKKIIVPSTSSFFVKGMSPMKIQTGIAFVLFLILGVFSQTEAQEYRVYTKVFQEQDHKDVIVSRSLTLFRSGKAYDHIDTLGEVIIFDPANEEFIILNMKRDIMTRVQFEQLKQQLIVARKTTQDYADQLASSSNKKKKTQAENLLFQLNPQFETEASDKKKKLKLTSPGLSYHVKGTKAEPTQVESYMNYADWMCRLNYVMHPSPFLPGCRVQLNKELSKMKMLPLQVEFMANVEPVLKLRAEHRIKNKLSKQDLTQIHAWESALKKETIRHVTFLEYQKTTLVTQLDN